MTIHLHKAIENLKKKILTLGAMVEETVQNAVLALDSDDIELAKDIIKNDTKIDEMEVEVEEECLKILALHQPVAIDLRYVVAVLKINSELERVGDLASNIAQRAVDLHDYPAIDFEFNFREMGEIAKSMLRSSLDALINLDSKQGRQVCADDDQIDQMHEHVFHVVRDAVLAKPENIFVYTQFLSVSRYLERIGDSATNIAEDVIYMVEGIIARHSPEKLRIDHD